MAKKNFLVTIRDAVAKLRPWIAGVFIVAFSIAPLIPYPSYKISIAVSFGIVLLYVFFDLYRELTLRLEGIEKSLKEPNPPTYEDFGEASVELDKTIKERLNANRNVHIRVLGVSAQFSWKHLVEEKLVKFLEMGNHKQNIKFEFVIVDPTALNKLKQTKLMADTQRTIKGIDIMREKYKSNQRLSIEVYKYDNIPHWHGVLVDTDTFFMGRCRWSIDGENYELEVGTNEYRLFKINDRFRGTDRVNLFINWFEAYRLQGEKI